MLTFKQYLQLNEVGEATAPLTGVGTTTADQTQLLNVNQQIVNMNSQLQSLLQRKATIARRMEQQQQRLNQQRSREVTTDVRSTNTGLPGSVNQVGADVRNDGYTVSIPTSV